MFKSPEIAQTGVTGTLGALGVLTLWRAKHEAERDKKKEK